jgi:putative ATP-dependent endonuclease of OLD family
MKVESVTIRGFRCFDEVGESIRLEDLTCFVGPNASGKTAAMMALSRLFGESSFQREVVPADFHLAMGEELASKSPRILTVECRLAFPELEGIDPGIAVAIPETFNQMIVDQPGATPYCRIRLEATWTDDGTLAGNIEQLVYWILTHSDDPKVIEDGNRRRVAPGERAKIRVVYVPAARDPQQQIRLTTATSFGRLLRALEWAGVDQSLREKLAALEGDLAQLSAVRTINSQIQQAWRGLYAGRVARHVQFRALEEDPGALINLLVPTFRPGEDSHTMVVADLSDGLRSLFAISLALGLFRVEELLRGARPELGFKPDVVEQLPILTIFAVEEPENHLSPHYLGRAVSQLASIAKDGHAQVIISSHSPSIMGRVSPDRVRYFLGHEQSASTHVKQIPLPMDEADEAFKYVREAVRGYPELYFARLVVLGEGPSEEIILRRLFEASGTPLDTHFISVVPLGGRHVNHFWRLLHALEIPFLTLLDLDREKEGAGWGRVQYVRDELVKRYGVGHASLQFKEANGTGRSLDEAEWDSLAERDNSDVVNMNAWLALLATQFDIFFSFPLDLDLAMLEAFPNAYKGQAPPPKGPRLPSSTDEHYNSAIRQRMRQVLAADATNAPEGLGSTYSDTQKELFAWYKYLFVDGSKPVAHMRALLSIDDASFSARAPETLKSLVERARAILLAEVR